MGITNKEMVSATQKVKMDDLVATAPVVSVEDALQGQLGGVDIVLGLSLIHILANFSIVIVPTKKLANGRHRIRIAVAHRSKTRYLSLIHIFILIDT